MIKISHNMQDEWIQDCESSGAALVRAAKLFARKVYCSIQVKGNPQMELLIVPDGKGLIRSTKGSSSEKGIGRSRIKDTKFEDQFDFYLMAELHPTFFILRKVEK